MAIIVGLDGKITIVPDTDSPKRGRKARNAENGNGNGAAPSVNGNAGASPAMDLGTAQESAIGSADSADSVLDSVEKMQESATREEVIFRTETQELTRSDIMGMLQEAATRDVVENPAPRIETLEELEAEEARIAAQLEELRATKMERLRILREEEERKRKELEQSQPYTFHVRYITAANRVAFDFSPATITRTDIAEVCGNLSLTYGNGSCTLEVWEKFAEKVSTLPNVTVEYEKGVAEHIHNLLHAPAWKVSLTTDRKYLKLENGPNTQVYDIWQIPGTEYDKTNRAFKIGIPEGWRLANLLTHLQEKALAKNPTARYEIEYSPEALAIVEAQLEKRAKIDTIATATDWPEYDVKFNEDGINLRPFQKVAGAFVEATGGKALLALEMGLGKTLIAISYAMKHDLRGVVICPASLKANWAREIARFTGEKPIVLSGSQPSQYDIITLLKMPTRFVIINYDVIGRKIEYDDVRKDSEGYDHVEHKTRYIWAEAISLANPDLVIFDESHYIKNTDSNRSIAARQIKAQRVIHMTGTPVLNRPGELWPLLTMLAPEQFPSEDLFLKQYTNDGKTARNVNELRELLKPIMIRRLKKDVIKDMPPINRIMDYHELSAKAMKLYKRVLEGVYIAIDAYKPGEGGTEKAIANILAQIQRLKMICAYDKVESTADLATRLYDETDESEPRKVLIFTQYKAVAHAIKARLGQEALSFVRYVESSKEYVTAENNERDRIVQEFQTNPDVHFLVVTEKTAKEGHNITAAGHVVFNDLFWTPAAHEQSEGRSYGRISDMHGINSYYRLADMEGESIDEWIWELLRKKLGVIQQVVEGVEASRDSSIAMELIEKLRQHRPKR